MVKEGSASGADEDGNDGDEEQEAGDEVCHFLIRRQFQWNYKSFEVRR